MNRRAIANTAVCRYDDKECCYIVQSPLFERCIGAAETEEEAHKIFQAMLDEYYIAHLEGKLVEYDRPGRPSKGYVDMHIQVSTNVKTQIAKAAKVKEISQGEFIEYLLYCHEQLPWRKTKSATVTDVTQRRIAAPKASKRQSRSLK